ncbi:MAG TPA: C1 family peptidase [Chloroflexota bacterium]|jgi:C1A family cysteine protease
MPYEIARFGWVRDLPDQRDHLYAAPPQFLTTMPSQVDLRSQCPPVYDQGQIGSCTANAIGAAHEFNQMKQKLPAPSPFVPSRLFIYYNERAIEHTTGSDSGAQIRDGMKSVAKLGVCREDPTWPYNADPFPPNNKLTRKPSAAAYREALKYQAIQYQRVPQVLSQMKGCLVAGYPFVFGFTVYESFEGQEVAKTGIVAMPQSGEQVLGGHAVLAVGYDDAQQKFIVRNSWGTGWGDKGYCHMPYLYLNDPQLASDFWTLRLIET